MNYEKIHTDYYNRYYSLFEYKIKRYYNEKKQQKRSFNNSSNELASYLSENLNNILENKNLKDVYTIFNNRFAWYEENQIEEVLKNEVKQNFDKIDPEVLPLNYNYKKLIKKLALVDVLKEISRLNSNNYNLLQMIYQLGNFDKFEIKYYHPIAIENTSIFKELQNELYPKNLEVDNFDNYTVEENNINLNPKDLMLPTSIAILNELGFFDLVKLKNYSTIQIAKIISIIQQKDPNNSSTIRAIAGNIRVLDPNYKEDGSKYTSHKHYERVKEILKNIK